MAEMWNVYILKSLKKQRFYIGVSRNLEKRLVDHNRGKTKSTKQYCPWVLVYKEEIRDKNEAYKREYFLKHPVGYLEKLRIISSIGGVA